MSETYVDITPDVHFLQSIRADRGKWHLLAAEGIDNAFDAGATEVLLTLNKQLVRIQDNGIGITRDRETALFRLGEHRAMMTTALGRFGIGIKYNAMSAGECLEVRSTSKDGLLYLEADWREMLRRGKWQIKAPEWTTHVRAVDTGTVISIKSLRWPEPKAADIDKTREELANIFYPALAVGRRVLLNGSPVPCLSEPKMTDIVEGDVRLESGKGAHVRAGMLVNTASPLCMVNLSYKHRVILPRSGFGCGDYSGIRKMFARVTLTSSWGLTRFKDGLEDPEAEELENAVRDFMRPILEKCHSAQMSAKVENMTLRLNEMLPEDLIPARARRKRPPKADVDKSRKRKPHGTVEDADPVPPGPARRKIPSLQSLQIEFSEPMFQEFGYGCFVPGKDARIQLAQDNPHIKAWLDDKDETRGARSLYLTALMIFEHARETNNPQRQLLDAPFGLRVWKLVERQPDIDSDEQSLGG